MPLRVLKELSGIIILLFLGWDGKHWCFAGQLASFDPSCFLIVCMGGAYPFKDTCVSSFPGQRCGIYNSEVSAKTRIHLVQSQVPPASRIHPLGERVTRQAYGW